MSYQRDREQFLIQATKEGLPPGVCRKLLRYATTLQRLAEAQCNGDWPADNGERKVELCPQCGAGFVKSSFKVLQKRVGPTGVGFYRICPDCRTRELVIAALGECPVNGLKAVFQGDPRGAVLKLSTPNFPYDECGKNGAYGLYVPAR